MQRAKMPNSNLITRGQVSPPLAQALFGEQSKSKKQNLSRTKYKRIPTSVSKHPRISSHICPADRLADRSICQAYQLAASNNHTTPSKAKQSKAKQSKVMQNKEKNCKEKQTNIMQHKAMWSNVKQSKIKQSKSKKNKCFWKKTPNWDRARFIFKLMLAAVLGSETP